MSFDLKINNGDVAIGNNGDFAIVEDTEKLTQDILKVAITQAGGNPWFPWYGSLVSKTLLGSAYDTEFIVSMGQSQLNSAIENIRSLQTVQAKSSQPITAGEHIAAIEFINIDRNKTDPRFFKVSISVITKALTRVNTNFIVSP
jgi:hypothetical protein